MRTGIIRAMGVVAVSAGLAGGASCYPGEVTSLSQLDLTLAIHDSSVNFQAIRTYALPDTIIHVVADTSDHNPPTISRKYDQNILDLVNANLQDLGYVRDPAPDPANPPDVLVLITASARSFTGATVAYPPYYFGGYWPPYGCCYGGYYPPYVVDVYNWDQGTLSVDMLRAVPDSANQRVPVVWSGILNGVLSPGAESLQRLEQGIGRMFSLSPYLHHP